MIPPLHLLALHSKAVHPDHCILCTPACPAQRYSVLLKVAMTLCLHLLCLYSKTSTPSSQHDLYTCLPCATAEQHQIPSLPGPIDTSLHPDHCILCSLACPAHYLSCCNKSSTYRGTLCTCWPYRHSCTPLEAANSTNGDSGTHDVTIVAGA